MTTTESLSSTAAVDTPRAGRYGKQLATHLGRRLVTEWDEHGDRLGRVRRRALRAARHPGAAAVARRG